MQQRMQILQNHFRKVTKQKVTTVGNNNNNKPCKGEDSDFQSYCIIVFEMSRC